MKKWLHLSQIEGVTKSFVSDEFIVHIDKGSDYWLVSEKKEEYIQCLKMAYVTVKKVNLPIFGVIDKKLQKYRTTEKEATKGITRMPSKDDQSSDLWILSENVVSPEEEKNSENFSSTSLKWSWAETGSFYTAIEDFESVISSSVRSSAVF